VGVPLLETGRFGKPFAYIFETSPASVSDSNANEQAQSAQTNPFSMKFSG
jgi:hypothetical protein